MPSAKVTQSELRSAVIETPIGRMVAIADPKALRLLEFLDDASLDEFLAARAARFNAQVSTGRAAHHSILAPLRDDLAAYFAGSLRQFETPVDPLGTAFQRAVWEELRRVPYGETRSYGAIAKAIGHEQAVRAIGQANSANPIAIVIPCHRVISASGETHGYAGGEWRKKSLLDLERKTLFS